MLLELETEGNPYQPGDHVGVFPCNRKELVDGIIQHLDEECPDKPVQLQLLKEKQTSTGVERVWTAHEKLPRCSLRTLLTRYMDITTPPSPNLLRFLASCAKDVKDQKVLDHLSSVSRTTKTSNNGILLKKLIFFQNNSVYEDWKHSKYPNLLEVFQEFPSCKPPIALLMSQLTLLQPRFYSISSSPLIFPKNIYLTLSLIHI